MVFLSWSSVVSVRVVVSSFVTLVVCCCIGVFFFLYSYDCMRLSSFSAYRALVVFVGLRVVFVYCVVCRLVSGCFPQSLVSLVCCSFLFSFLFFFFFMLRTQAYTLSFPYALPFLSSRR